ncbi:hypothetical protein MP638_005216, partial [Amoeboaphelidium occidentale]
SLIMAKMATTQVKVVLFFPSIALVYQFYRQHSDEREAFPKQLIVCSSDEIDKSDTNGNKKANAATTEMHTINRELGKLSHKDKRLVLCTYHSSKLLLSCQDSCEHQFDLALFDEAHNRRVYGSATVPGQLSAEYTTIFKLSCAEAISKGLVRDYEIVCPLYGQGSDEVLPEDSPERQKLLIECIANAISDYNRSRVILFHRFSQTSGQSSASSVEMYHENNDLFVENIKRFAGANATVYIHSATAATKNRDEVFESIVKLKEVLNFPNADMAVLIDRKESFNQIVQNIGRTLRKTADDKVAIIFVPVYVDGVEG